MTDLKVGKLIKEKRVKKNLSQNELAKLSGLSIYYINRVESGRIKNPGILRLHKIAKGLGEKIYDLFSEEKLYKESEKFVPDYFIDLKDKDEINIKIINNKEVNGESQ